MRIFECTKKSGSCFIFVAGFFLMMLISSCEKYLDEKSDKALAVPSTLEDLQRLLDNYQYMNSSFPLSGEEAADNYYVTYNTWMGLTGMVERNNYIWMEQGERSDEWTNVYRQVFNANVVLDLLDEVNVSVAEEHTAAEIRGSALFFRAFGFYELAQVYAPVYDTGNSDALGIPLRLNSNYNEKSERATLAETYNRIIVDLKEASRVLPEIQVLKSRPSKAAAFAQLARVYLSMSDYDQAGFYADSCLQLYNTLIDYKTLNPDDALPIPQFSEEVIFAARSFSESSLFYQANCRIDSILNASYSAGDLRKVIYFQLNEDSSANFKGNYDGYYYGQLFDGLAVDEILLIRAECRARVGNIALAQEDLNTLLSKRYAEGTFEPFSFSGAEQGLDVILEERRKELVFRGLRWTDLRRLNKEPRYSKTLTRKMNGITYELAPGDVRYTMLIPQTVINLNGIQQNER